MTAPKHTQRSEPEDAPTSWWWRHTTWLGPAGSKRQDRIWLIVGAVILVGMIVLLVMGVRGITAPGG